MKTGIIVVNTYDHSTVHHLFVDNGIEILNKIRYPHEAYILGIEVNNYDEAKKLFDAYKLICPTTQEMKDAMDNEHPYSYKYL